jgi:MFS transporter, DHA2 family, multidrug resistance protein
MSQLNLKISPWHVFWPRVVMVAGLGLVFALLNVAAYLYTPRALRGAAVGLLALLRNEGGSVGIQWVRPLPSAARYSMPCGLTSISIR